MALNPRMVATDVDVAYDGGLTHVLRGTVIDCPPGSAMEAAYGGPGNLVPLSDQDAQAISFGASGSAAGSGDLTAEAPVEPSPPVADAGGGAG